MKKGQLSKENLKAAKAIARYLKKYKSISLVEFKKLWWEARGWLGCDRPWGKVEAHKYYTSDIYSNTVWFLRNHNIMTRETVNGFVLFVATQKCVRSKEENWFTDKLEF